MSFPKELNFELPSSFIADSKEYRINPSTGSQAYSTPGTVISFQFPQLERSFMETPTLYLTGKIRISNTLNTTDVFNGILMGSAYSAFSRQVTSHNNTVLETIERPGLLATHMQQLTLGLNQKLALAGQYLFSTTNPDGNFGWDVKTVTATQAAGYAAGAGSDLYFSLPVIGAIGSLTKFFPLCGGNLQIDWTVNDVASFIQKIGGTGSGVFDAFELSQLELVFNAVTLHPEQHNELMKSIDNKIVLKSESWQYSAPASLTASFIGSTDVPVTARLKSLKRLLWTCQPAGTPINQSVNPNLTNYQLYVGSRNFPQQPVKCSNIAEAFAQNKKALGAMGSYMHSGCVLPLSFGRASTAYSNAYIAYNATLTYTTGTCNQWVQLIDTEVINASKDALFNGISSEGTNSFLRLNVGTALAAVSHLISMWANYDMLIAIDINSMTTVATF